MNCAHVVNTPDGMALNLYDITRENNLNYEQVIAYAEEIIETGKYPNGLVYLRVYEINYYNPNNSKYITYPHVCRPLEDDILKKRNLEPRYCYKNHGF